MKSPEEMAAREFMDSVYPKNWGEICEHHQANFLRQLERTMVLLERYEQADYLKDYRLEHLADEGLYQDDDADLGQVMTDGSVRFTNCRRCYDLHHHRVPQSTYRRNR